MARDQQCRGGTIREIFDGESSGLILTLQLRACLLQKELVRRREQQRAHHHSGSKHAEADQASQFDSNGRASRGRSTCDVGEGGHVQASYRRPPRLTTEAIASARVCTHAAVRPTIIACTATRSAGIQGRRVLARKRRNDV